MVFHPAYCSIRGVRWMYPDPNVPRHGKSPYKAYITWVFMGKLSPRIPREHNKYHGYTVRGTPHCSLIQGLNVAFWWHLEDHPRHRKWLVTPIYKPFRLFIMGITPFRGHTITMVINHVSVQHGMILQVGQKYLGQRVNLLMGDFIFRRKNHGYFFLGPVNGLRDGQRLFFTLRPLSPFRTFFVS